MLPADVTSDAVPVIHMTLGHPIHVRTWKSMTNKAAVSGINMTFTTLVESNSRQATLNQAEMGKLLQSTPAFICTSGNGKERGGGGDDQPGAAVSRDTCIRTSVTGYVNKARDAILFRREVHIQNMHQPNEYRLKDHRRTSGTAVEQLMMEQKHGDAIGLELKMKFSKGNRDFTLEDCIGLRHLGSLFTNRDCRETKHVDHEVCGQLDITCRESTFANDLELWLDRTLTLALPANRINEHWNSTGSIERRSNFPTTRQGSAEKEQDPVIQPRLRFVGQQQRRRRHRRVNNSVRRSQSAPTATGNKPVRIRAPRIPGTAKSTTSTCTDGARSEDDEGGGSNTSSGYSRSETVTTSASEEMSAKPKTAVEWPVQQREKNRVTILTQKPAEIQVPLKSEQSESNEAKPNDKEAALPSDRSQEDKRKMMSMIEDRILKEPTNTSQSMSNEGRDDNDAPEIAINVEGLLDKGSSWLVRTAKQAEKIYERTSIAPVIIAGRTRNLLAAAAQEEDDDDDKAPMTALSSEEEAESGSNNLGHNNEASSTNVDQ